MQQGTRNHAPNDLSLGVQQTNRGSTSTFDALDAIKVLVDDIDCRYENFPVPMMTKEVVNLQKVVGTLILWLGIEIILAKEQRTKKQIPSTSLVPTNVRVGTNKNIPNQPASKARPIEYLHDYLKTNPLVNIVANSGILEVGTYDFSVTSEEYFR
ncbi:unnamed protein product [Lactuca saligna]|uniref:Uncharacterized protein n=1 Tax=Lactuca saligna TaxID=75948 RepID=A0AA35YXP0_LACSI|nr:unnamed protein product [Lactuca saligna]